jgi:hypothetical protein
VKSLNVGAVSKLLHLCPRQHLDLHRLSGRASFLCTAAQLYHAGLWNNLVFLPLQRLDLFFLWLLQLACAIAVSEERNELVSDPAFTFRHDYPPTKLMFIPDKEWQHPDLLVSGRALTCPSVRGLCTGQLFRGWFMSWEQDIRRYRVSQVKHRKQRPVGETLICQGQAWQQDVNWTSVQGRCRGQADGQQTVAISVWLQQLFTCADSSPAFA